MCGEVTNINEAGDVQVSVMEKRGSCYKWPVTVARWTFSLTITSMEIKGTQTMWTNVGTVKRRLCAELKIAKIRSDLYRRPFDSPPSWRRHQLSPRGGTIELGWLSPFRLLRDCKHKFFPHKHLPSNELCAMDASISTPLALSTYKPTPIWK